MNTYDAAKAASPAAAAPFEDFPITQVSPPTATVATDEIIIFDTNGTSFLSGLASGSFSRRGSFLSAY